LVQDWDIRASGPFFIKSITPALSKAGLAFCRGEKYFSSTAEKSVKTWFLPLCHWQWFSKI